MTSHWLGILRQFSVQCFRLQSTFSRYGQRFRKGTVVKPMVDDDDDDDAWPILREIKCPADR